MCNCKSNTSCEKTTELKYTSQIIYDGDPIVLQNAGINIDPCDNLNDIITKFAEKIEELTTP